MGEGLSGALLAKVCPASEWFCRKLGEAIVRRLHKISTRLWNKGNAGSPASEEMLNEITSSSTIAMAGYGH